MIHGLSAMVFAIENRTRITQNLLLFPFFTKTIIFYEPNNPHLRFTFLAPISV